MSSINHDLIEALKAERATLQAALTQNAAAIAAAYGKPVALLEQLFLSMYSSDELRRAVRLMTCGSEIEKTMIGPGASAQEIARSAAIALVSHIETDAVHDILNAVRQERYKRAHEVDAVARELRASGYFWSPPNR